MSLEVGRIDLGLDINQKSFNQQLHGIAGGAEKSVKSAFSGLGSKIGFTLGMAAITSFTKSCLELGSNLTEVQNVVDTVFPSLNGQVNDFAKNAMEQFGLSETVAKKYTGTLGAMSKSMGFSESAALSMAEGIAGLSGDVASFYNMSSDEAYTKLKSIWTGETESLKELGVIMTQTNLDQYAMNSGFGKTTSAMDEQTKTMLRYQYVTSALSAAQGDFAKTSDSWANQIRALSLRFDSLKATIGQGLINLFTPIIQGLNNLISRLQVGAEAFRSFTELITGKSVATSTGAVATNALTATENILGMGDAAASSAKKAAGALAGFDELNNISKAAAAGVSTASNTSSETPSTKTSSDSDGLLTNEKIKPALDALEKLKSVLQPIGKFVFDNVKDFYKDFLAPVGGWILGEGLPRLAGALGDLLEDVDWEKLSGALDAFWEAAAPLAKVFGQGFLDFMTELADILKPYVADSVSDLADSINGTASALSLIDPEDVKEFGRFVGFAVTLGGVAKGVAGFYKIFTSVMMLLGGLADKIDAIELFLTGGGLTAITTFLTNLTTLNPIALPALFDLLGLDDWLNNLYDKLPGWATGLWEGFWDFVAQMFQNIFNYDNTFALIKDWIAAWNDVFDGTKDSWQEIGINIIKGIVGVFAVPLSFILEPIADFFTSLWDAFCDCFGIASPAKEMKPIGEYILKGIMEGFTNTFTEWWTSITTWGTETKEKFRTWAGGIWSGIKEKFTGSPTWFKTKFDSAFNNLKSAFSLESIATHFNSVLSNIKAPFSGIAEWFKTKFTEAWTNVKNVFSTGGKIFDGIKDGIAETFKTVVNGLIDGINKIIKTPFDKINTMLNSIRDVSVLGFQPFKNLWGVNPLSIPQITPFAEGGYVGANQPRLAMIGDNKKEGEIVSPESKFQEMLNLAAQLSGGGGITEEILYRVMSRVFRENQLILVPDEKGIFKLVRKSSKEYYESTGENALAY